MFQSAQILFKNILKSLIKLYIEYGGDPVSRDGNWNVILRLEDYTKKRGRLGLTTSQHRRMKDDHIENYKIINGISNHARHFLFSIFLFEVEIYYQSRFQKLNLLIGFFFFDGYIYFWKKLPNQMKKSNSVKIIKLNWIISERKEKEFKLAF